MRAVLCCTVLFTSVGIASAEPPGSTPPRQPTPPKKVRVDAWVGFGTSTSVRHDDGSATPSPMVSFGASFVGQHGHLGLGVGADIASAMFEEGHTHVSALAGAVSAPAAPVRLEGLAEGGLHRISGLGRGLFSEVVEGGSANLPYLGLRAGTGVRVGRVDLGLWALARHDLVSTEVVSVTRSANWFSSGYTYSEERTRVGGFEMAAGLRLGGRL